MTPQTRKNVLKALRAEAFAFVKYTLFAQQARESGRDDLAKLFDDTAQTERLEHFAQQAALIVLVGNDKVNLRNAIRNESYEVETMYREFAEQATAAGDDDAAARFAEVGRDEVGHRDAFAAALEKIEAEA